MLQLTQPVRLVATAFVPDRKFPGMFGKKYGLIQWGACYYALIFLSPAVARGNEHACLGCLPVALLLKRHFPQAPAAENEQGHLFFRSGDEALAWFTDVFTVQVSGELTMEEAQ